ncbi:MAG TPA: hypothetical protein VE172_01425, partial [Stackebrandtia sp.]
MVRLWAAASREDLPNIAERTVDDAGLTITTRDGRVVRGGVPRPFDAACGPVTVDGTPVDDPAALAALLAHGSRHAERLASEITAS